MIYCFDIPSTCLMMLMMQHLPPHLLPWIDVNHTFMSGRFQSQGPQNRPKKLRIA